MTKMVNQRWSRLRRRASFGAVWVLLLSGLAACGGEAEASRLLASCGGSATRTSFDASDQQPETIGAVSFRVTGARAGESILGLDDAEGGNAWLVVSILIDNPTPAAIHVDSDDYVLVVDGERVKETADESDDVSERLGVDEMGNVMGSSVGAGRSEPFALIYEVPTGGESYELSVSHDGRSASFDLLPAIDSCMETAALIPTTAPPTAMPTEAPTSTPVPTATMSAVEIAQANATNTPRPAPTRTATPRATATEAPPSNVTHLD